MSLTLQQNLWEETSEYYKPNDIDKVLFLLGTVQTVKDKHKKLYYNIPCSFDIETSSFYQSNELDKESKKVAIMYEWTLNLNFITIIGRTWKEFEFVYYKLVDYFNLQNDLRLIIYVHNLAFDFQFIKNLFEWDNVFSMEKRKPIKAVTIDGVEFRCSYLLSGYSLENLGEQLQKYKVKKLVGDLDYDLIRHPNTVLSKKEIEYCINDCLVVVSYIKEQIEQCGSIIKIPLTKTGYVREYCRNRCLYNDGTSNKRDKKKYQDFRRLMKILSLDKETYIELKEAFSGGFTHANPFYSRQTIKDVYSDDFTSSYPFVMISEKFPMSEPRHINSNELDKETFENYLNKYCCLFECEFYNLESKYYFENYISVSHCRELKDGEVNNGRLVSASHCKITVTEQDYFIIKNFYTWDDVGISRFTYFVKSYLPKDLVLSILQLYYDKTTLKNVDGKEVEYLQSKEKINSIYGMSVTDIVRDIISYNTDWTSVKPDIDEEIEKYNKSVKRFLYYPWGIWVTAYARMNLFTGIYELKDDYIYSDTDSVKYINRSNHLDYFNSYNEYAVKKLQVAMKYQGIDIELTRPKNIKGEIKQIGIWDFEDKYTRFKTLGAKRYLVEYEKNGKLEHKITVSGVNKEKAVKYLEDTYKDKLFDYFDDSLDIPAEHTGKLIHTYIDEKRSGKVIDYQGNIYEYNESSGVHLEKAKYSLSLNQMYIEFLLGIKNYEK